MSSTGVGATMGGIVGAHNGNSGMGGGGGGGGGPCGACKFLRRKCVKECIFAPYFDSEQGVTNFAAVHKVFGASNTSKLLHKIPPLMRPDAVVSICYEAQARLSNPVYGCTNEILALQEEIVTLRSELINMQTFFDNMVPTTQSTFVAQPQTLMTDAFPVYNLPSPPNMIQPEVQWAPYQQESQLPEQLQQQPLDQEGDNDIAIESDLQALAWEFLNERMIGGGSGPSGTQ